MYYLPVLRHFIAPAYWEGLAVVPIMMAAELCAGVFFNLSLWYKLTDRTRWGMYLSLICFAVMFTLNVTQCDSLLLSPTCGAHTFPYMDIRNDSAIVEHEATTSKISEAQLFYCNQRGIPTEEAVALIVNGYAKEVMNKLPMEFAVEAQSGESQG